MMKADDAPQTNDERIAWVLAHPRMSPWLKAALEGGRQSDPIEVQNDLEILNLLLRVYVAEELDASGAVSIPSIEHAGER